MLPRRFLLAVLLVLVGVVAAAPPAQAAGPVRIMPLGDSITAGPGCWRAKLWHRLQTSGYTNIDFVGTQSDGGGCNPGYSYDFDHEGHGGYSATGIAGNDQLPPWLAAARPDVVLMHLGTNDMWGGYIPLADKLTAFTKLVGQMRAQNPAMKIVVAQIIPMSAAACSTCPADVVALNNALPAWAAGLTTAQSPIVLADLWTGYDAVADNVDGVHPNDTGFQKMSDAWYPVVARVLGGTTPTTPPTTPPTTTPTTPPTTTPTTPPTTAPTTPPTTAPAGACTATYRVVSQWTGGFQGEVTVANGSASTSAGWTATFGFANGQTVSQAWNATVTQSGATVTARNADWNGRLAPGGTATFGFLASSAATNTVPAGHQHRPGRDVRAGLARAHPALAWAATNTVPAETCALA
ncbi:cellulose binding domain-containing protein [Actinoplanes subtropicus]|uniref:cellulose binding domain-containing protein n=1 Tax=Actinoplanes subtropicus TaxID=543632 RepID=UPI000AC04DA3|nr:cellulose binding domain-containing protein [Actinoplanes subtropicus]